MNPLAMACRACNAAPGTACVWVGLVSDRFHATRESDAALSVATLIEIARMQHEADLIRAASPAVIVRKSAEP